MAVFGLGNPAVCQSPPKEQMDKISKWYPEHLQKFQTNLESCDRLAKKPEGEKTDKEKTYLEKCPGMKKSLKTLEFQYQGWEQLVRRIQDCDNPKPGDQPDRMCVPNRNTLIELTHQLYDGIPAQDR
jgi:hypothetical protein